MHMELDEGTVNCLAAVILGQVEEERRGSCSSECGLAAVFSPTSNFIPLLAPLSYLSSWVNTFFKN